MRSVLEEHFAELVATTIDSIVIYDLSGKQVYAIDALGTNSFQSSFGVGSLSAGSYIVSLQRGGVVVVSEQFVKR